MTDKTEAPDPEAPAPDYEFHPIANLFPLISDEELADLTADIKANGMNEPITIYEGQILDGRNRYLAAKLASVVLKNWQCRPFVRGDAEAFVISANIRRRHLTTEQKRDLLAKQIKANPAASGRKIARIAGVDNKTVEAVRDDLEGREEIPQRKKRKRPTRTETQEAVAAFKKHREAMVEAISRYADTTHAGEHVQDAKDRLDTAVKQLGEFFDEQNEKDAA
jgi:hypothetical protein